MGRGGPSTITPSPFALSHQGRGEVGRINLLLGGFLRRRLGLIELRFVLIEYLALENPNLNADLPVGRRRLGESVIDIRAQRVQRHTALAIPLGAGDFGAVQPTRHHDLDAERAQAHGVRDRALHRAAEHDALLELLRDILRHELRVELGLTHFLDRKRHRHTGETHQLLAQFLDVFALLADHDTRSRGVHRDVDALRRALDDDRAHRRVRELLLQEATDLEIGNQVLHVRVVVRVPTRVPVANDAESKSDRIDFLTHYLPPPALALSATITVI